MKNLIIGLGIGWVACKNRAVFIDVADRILLSEEDYEKLKENKPREYKVIGTGRLLDSIEDKLTDIENRLDKTI